MWLWLDQYRLSMAKNGKDKCIASMAASLQLAFFSSPPTDKIVYQEKKEEIWRKISTKNRISKYKNTGYHCQKRQIVLKPFDKGITDILKYIIKKRATKLTTLTENVPINPRIILNFISYPFSKCCIIKHNIRILIGIVLFE